jgi:hypothetical protein
MKRCQPQGNLYLGIIDWDAERSAILLHETDNLVNAKDVLQGYASQGYAANSSSGLHVSDGAPLPREAIDYLWVKEPWNAGGYEWEPTGRPYITKVITLEENL